MQPTETVGTDMNYWLNRRKIAKWSLGFVMLVIFVCSGQNISFTSSCPSSYHYGAVSYANDLNSAGTMDAEKQCDLTDHLLQQHQLSFEHALVSFSILFLLIALVTSYLYQVPLLTEPIPPPRRRHLTLCVFRE